MYVCVYIRGWPRARTRAARRRSPSRATSRRSRCWWRPAPSSPARRWSWPCSPRSRSAELPVGSSRSLPCRVPPRVSGVARELPAPRWKKIRVRAGEPKYGRSSELHVFFVFPDPGVLNSCMHTFPATNDGLTMV